MPESPEVRIITEYLNAHCAGWVLINIDFVKKYEDTCDIKSKLPLKIDGVTCKGKHIVWLLSMNDDTKVYFHNHLGMTGRWSPTEDKHTNLHFIMKRGDETKSIYFDDTRRFGKFNVCLSLEELEGKIGHVGIDLMNTSIKYYGGDKEYLVKVQKKWIDHYVERGKNRSKERQIYVDLLDQKYFSGLGNYLTADILYLCRISPSRKLKDLSRSDVINLFNVAIKTLYISYKHNGLTIKDYWGPEGNKGEYPYQVYNRTEDDHGHKVIQTKFSNNRVCHWAPEVQK